MMFCTSDLGDVGGIEAVSRELETKHAPCIEAGSPFLFFLFDTTGNIALFDLSPVAAEF
jgi:hypothetical protein